MTALTGASELADVAMALRAPRERIETAFVKVGDGLSSCVDDLVEIAELFERLTQDFESAEIREATAKLDAVAEQAMRMGASFADERPVMNELIGAVARVRPPIEDLMVGIRTISMVALNARIAASSLPGDVQGIDVFKTDIVAVSEEAAEVVKAFVALYERLSTDVSRAARQRALFEAANETLLEDMAERIRVRLAGLARRREQAASASIETVKASRRISERISAAVFALQVGDNTRQRIEHVETALDRFGATGGLDALDPAAREAFMTILRSLQSSQLEDAAVVFDAELTRAGGSIQGLERETNDLLTGSQALYGFESGDAASVAALNKELLMVAAALGDCEAQRSKIDTLARDVAGATGALLDHVGSVNATKDKMRLLSLNATVQCGRLGAQGRALTVIAEQIRELTVGTAQSAKSALDGLERIAELARGLSADDEVEAAAAAGGAHLEQDASSAAALLGKVERRLESAVKTLAVKSPQVAAHLERASDALAEMSSIGVDLRRENARIASRTAMILTPHALPEAGLALLAEIRGGYTMDSERRLHDALLGLPPPRDAAHGSGADADRDIFDEAEEDAGADPLEAMFF